MSTYSTTDRQHVLDRLDRLNRMELNAEGEYVFTPSDNERLVRMFATAGEDNDQS